MNADKPYPRRGDPGYGMATVPFARPPTVSSSSLKTFNGGRSTRITIGSPITSVRTMRTGSSGKTIAIDRIRLCVF